MLLIIFLSFRVILMFFSLQREKEDMKNIVSDNPQLKQRNAKIKLIPINDCFFPHLDYSLPNTKCLFKSGHVTNTVFGRIFMWRNDLLFIIRHVKTPLLNLFTVFVRKRKKQNTRHLVKTRVNIIRLQVRR